MATARRARADMRTSARRADVCEGCGTKLNAYNPLRWCALCVRKRRPAELGTRRAAH